MKESNNKRTKKKVKIFSKKKNVDSIDKVIKTLESAEIDISKVKTFKNLPLSPSTLKGLSENGYDIPTEIQRESLVFTLQGLDILGAAKTGSGKTLAFLIPVLETLFKKKWTKLDGVGALIITPTRELAYQIFETIKKVGFHHDFSVGLIIGGKDLHFEKHRMDRVNIVICTPGRLLHHMDENPLFDCVNLQILVLDEADRCLDLGFEKTMNSIIENLPAKRQTLLFSATQTRSVKDLARLSLKDPKYVSVHEHSQYSTPEGLTQSYVVCDLHDKMAMLWSFIKNHPKHKIIVFLSSCKQVKYTFEILCKLRPFTALLALYGSLHQERRMTIYNSFVSKHNAVLLATDIAARGLDFPEVNWVVQLDCPEDANTYIHRAGRTARFQKGGESLLVLLPSEKEAMLENLQEKKIPINEIKINPLKLTNPQVKMEAFLARDPNLKASAQRAFVAYLKSVFLMKDKKVFNINALNCDTYARSLGLVLAPRIRFLQKHNKTLMQNTNKTENTSPTLETEETESDDKQSIQPPIPKGKEVYNFGGGDSDSEDDLLVIKRQDHQLEGGNPEEDEEKYMLEKISNTMKKKPLTKVALAKKLLKKNIVPNKKVVFTDTGETMEDQMKAKTTEEGRQYEAAGEGGIDITEAKKVMRAEDKIDRKLFREKIKAKHREERFKKKKMNKKQKENENEVDAYSGSESEGSEPDLSWLPDPDKLYGEKSADCSGAKSHSEDEKDSSERIPTRLTGKNVKAKNKNKSMFQKEETSFRKKRSGNSDSENEAYTELQDNEHYDGESTQQGFSCLRKKGKNKHKESNPAKKLKIAQGSLDDDKTFDTGLSLKEDEELVLKFLSSKR